MTVGEVSKSRSKSISTLELGTLKTWSVSGWEDGITEKNKGEIRYGIRGW